MMYVTCKLHSCRVALRHQGNSIYNSVVVVEIKIKYNYWMSPHSVVVTTAVDGLGSLGFRSYQSHRGLTMNNPKPG